MQIEIERNSLMQALAIVGGVVEPRQTLPILGNLLLTATGDEVRLTATDLGMEITTLARCRGAAEGQATLPAHKLRDICRALPDNQTLHIKVNDDQGKITSGRSRFSLPTLPAADYPALLAGTAAVSVTMERGVLRRVLDKSAIAMAQQDVRNYLNGVLLELSSGRMVAVATDGHLLAKIVEAVPGGTRQDGADGVLRSIVPAKTIGVLRRLLGSTNGEVTLHLSDRTLRVTMGDTVLTSWLVDGKFPDYERVIPKNLPKSARIERARLRAALTRTEVLSTEKYKGVLLTFSPGALRMELSNTEQEQAEDEVDMDYEGEETNVGFNVTYVLDVLGAMGGNTAEVAFDGTMDCTIWRGEGQEGETFVIMPMRL